MPRRLRDGAKRVLEARIGGQRGHPSGRRSGRSAARPSTARRRTPATACSRRTTPRSRRTSRSRSTRRRPTAPPTTDPAAEAGRQRRRPRLRQPVRPAHRPPRPRAERLLRAAAVRHAAGRSWSAAARKAIILSGGPNSVYDDGAPQARPRDLERPACPSWASATAPSSWPTSSAATCCPPIKREYGPATVTITDRRRPVRGHRARAAGLDEPRRLDHPAAGGLPLDRPDRLDAVRRPRRRRPEPVRHPVPSRGRPHAARPRRPAQLRPRHRRARADLDARRTSSTRPSPRSASGSTRHAAATGSDGKVICALSGGVDSAVAAALVHRAVGDRLTCIYVDHGLMRKKESELLRETFEREPGHEPGHGRRARALPRPPGRRRGPGAEAPDHRRRVHPRLRGGGRARSARHRLPDPGHALPRRHRERHAPRRRPPRRSRPTTTSAACRPTCASSSSSRCATCSRTRSARSGSSWACPRRWSMRQPFPGPGLAIRIIGEVTAERLDTLREADWIVIDEIKARRAVPQRCGRRSRS